MICVQLKFRNIAISVNLKYIKSLYLVEIYKLHLLHAYCSLQTSCLIFKNIYK